MTKSKLDIVRALVAKANSTTFPAEAETFRAKAEALITKYGLDRKATGIDGDPVEPEGDPLNNWLRDFMRERETEHRRDLRRDPGNRYSSTQLYRAAKMRNAGLTWKEIGLTLGIKATAHLSKTLRDLGYVER